MSYHLVAPRSLADSIHPLYSLQPLPTQPQPQPLPVLAQAPEKKPMDPELKKFLIGVGVVIAIALVMYLIEQYSSSPKKVTKNRRRSTAKKMSTGELAKNLYSRLERRGGVADTTMRSLRNLSRNA
jgi:hypothetical protein